MIGLCRRFVFGRALTLHKARLLSETQNPSATKAKGESSEKEQPVAEEKPEGAKLVEEIDGPKGPEPTRYGDWERKGRCIDF